MVGGADVAGDGAPEVVGAADCPPVALGKEMGETDVPDGKTVAPVNGAAIEASVPARFATGPPGKV